MKTKEELLQSGRKFTIWPWDNNDVHYIVVTQVPGKLPAIETMAQYMGIFQGDQYIQALSVAISKAEDWTKQPDFKCAPWRPLPDQPFFFVCSSGTVEFSVSGSFSRSLEQVGNCFQTREEAEKIAPKFLELFKKNK